MWVWEGVAWRGCEVGACCGCCEDKVRVCLGCGEGMMCMHFTAAVPLYQSATETCPWAGVPGVCLWQEWRC